MLPVNTHTVVTTPDILKVRILASQFFRTVTHRMIDRTISRFIL